MEHIQKVFSSLSFTLRKEWAGILGITLLFFLFPLLVRQIDNTAAAIDPGIISAVILAVASVLVFKASTWWLIKTIWPALAEYSEYKFVRNFNGLPAIQKVIIYLTFYLMVFYGFIATLASII